MKGNKKSQHNNRHTRFPHICRLANVAEVMFETDTQQDKSTVEIT
jgi:hypothetical protein